MAKQLSVIGSGKDDKTGCAETTVCNQRYTILVPKPINCLFITFDELINNKLN